MWLAGELAGWLWTRRWPPSDAGATLGVLAHLLRDPAHPASAWPAAARHDLAPAPALRAALIERDRGQGGGQAVERYVVLVRLPVVEEVDLQAIDIVPPVAGAGREPELK